LLEEESEVNIYLFGSFLQKRESNDIDLLVVYNKISFSFVKQIKKNISICLQDIFGLPVHFTTLTKEELGELRNLDIRKTHLVYGF